MKKKDPHHIVERVYRRMGFRVPRIGTNLLVSSTLLCWKDPRAMTAVTKQVYRYLAKRYDTCWRNVEHDMRNVVEQFWKEGNVAMLNEMVGYELRAKPTVGEIICYMVGYIWDEGLLDEFDADDFERDEL